MSQKKFVTNLALLLFLNLLIKPFWILGIDREVQNLVGETEYGLYFALFNLSLVMNILLDVGITNFNNRNISQHSFLLNKHLSSLVVLKLLLAIFYSIILLVVGVLLQYDERKLWMLVGLGFNQFLLSFILYLRSNIQGLHLFKIDSFISVLDRLLMIFICGGLLLSHTYQKRFTVEHFIWIQSFCYFLTALFTLVIVLKKARLKRLQWNPMLLRVILKKSFPFAMLTLLMAFYNRIDTVMLERLLPDGAEQSGIYAQAYRLLDSANMIAYLFSVLLLPLFSKMLKEKESIGEVSQLAFRLLFVPALILVGLCISFNKEIITMLYPQSEESSYEVLAVLMLCFLPICSSYVFGTLLTANGSLRELNYIALGSMVLNVGLNFVFIPTMKANGAALASLTTQVFNSIAQVWIVRQKFKINFSIYDLLRFSILSIFCIFGFSLISNQFSSMYWLLKFISLGGLGLVIAFLLQLISIKTIYKVFRSE
ncbi:MAG: polysaccharide biosynthesis C-terminal domain-containing protein [Bacteroidia bacterium]|nr:polysaccharide biosynthesis C-terminal domain-containing protein [Bacteroidia bacterium]